MSERSRAEAARIIRLLARERRSTMLGSLAAERKDSFYILIATVLSVRNTDESTEVVSRELLRRYPTPHALMRARRSTIERIIRPTGFYKTKAERIKRIAQIIIDEHEGIVPDDFASLLALPGVGRKVAGCVRVYAFGHADCIPVDTHVHRLSNRLGWVATRDPDRTEQELMRLLPRRVWPLVNDVLVYHGKRICRPQRPLCGRCPVVAWCDRRGVVDQ